MKHVHASHCIVGMAIAVALLLAFDVSAGTLGVLAVALACPLMMLVMMRMMSSHQPAARQDEPTQDRTAR